MGGLELIQALYEYNEWANNRILEAAAALSDEELARDLGASYGSVAGSLAHAAGAQIVSLGRWRGSPPEDVASLYAPLTLLEEAGPFAAVRETLEKSHAALRRFVGSLTEDELTSELPYVDGRGVSRSRPLWQLMVQVVNHGTQHRSEAAMALTSLGRSPGDLDYVYFMAGGKTTEGSINLVQALYEYNEWANKRILEAAAALSDEELGRELGASYGGVRGNLAHTVGAQIVWLARWTGSRPEELSQLQSARDIGAIQGVFGKSHEGLRRFVGSLEEQALDRTVAYVDSRGVARERPLWQLMVHVVNHGTQHRSEAAMALTSLGRSPGDLDYVYFEYARQEI